MPLVVFLLSACFLATLCYGQSITPAPTASCNYCFLAPGFTDTSSAHEEYLLFTAYSMTSAFTQNGFCFTVSGASTSLQTQYSVAKPSTTASTNSAIASARLAEYSSAAATWFVNFLNVPDWGVCGANGSLAVHMADDDATTTQFVNVAVPTGLGAISRTPLLASSSSTTSTVGVVAASSGLSTSDKALIGVGVPVIVLMVVLPGLILWFRLRKQRAAALMERKLQEKLGTETESEIYETLAEKA